MTAKRETIKFIESLPDNVSLEEIIYELYVREQNFKGLKDIKEGKTITHEEVMRIFRDKYVIGKG